MAPLSCPIRLVALHLLGRSGEIQRILFLDPAGHISPTPHWLPREQALVLAANQRLVWGTAAEVLVL
jgi:hypothetical protein